MAAAATLASGLAQAVTSPDVAASERAEVRLHADRDVAAPGETVTLALEMRLAPGWHTYWVNPGDTGMATTVEWTAPEGVEVSALRYPTPRRQEVFDLINYGFEDAATLTATFQVPQDWTPGAPIRLEAAAMWLVCAELCVPERHTFTIEIPTGAAGLVDAAAAQVIARALSAHPEPLEAQGAFAVDGETLSVFAPLPLEGLGQATSAYFFSAEWAHTTPSAPQTFTVDARGVTLTTRVGETPPTDAASGVVVVETTGVAGGDPLRLSWRVDFRPGEVVSASDVVSATDGGGATAPGSGLTGSGASSAGIGGAAGMSMLTAALFAFLGGVILNVMPCVFPVLALKAFAFARHSDDGVAGAAAARRARMADGLAYGAGVLTCFAIFAGAIVLLRAGGEAVGWGFQLQQPGVVAALAAVLFLVGLNFSGVFEMPAVSVGGRLGAGVGAAGRFVFGRSFSSETAGSYFTGVLAAIVASPCTAPFMGAALGFALTRPVAEVFLIFSALGLGFAAPIMLLSMRPALGRLLPKPGPWMVRFKEFLAFPMYLAAAWLVWVLGGQAGVDAVFAALAGLVLIALGAWAYGAASGVQGGVRLSPWGRRAALGAMTAAALGAAASFSAAAGLGGGATVDAEPFSAARLAALREEGRPVFVNMTADWCVSCKVNERVVLRGDAFARALAESGVVYMVGDWTSPNDEIAAFLAQHGVNSVPFYAVFPAEGGAPQVLPTILTSATVGDALAAAAGPR